MKVVNLIYYDRLMKNLSYQVRDLNKILNDENYDYKLGRIKPVI